MSTMIIARPGTPFPSDESLSYFNQPMSSSSSSRRPSQSIHFPLPTRPVLTPPSLLQRTSSSGSSHYHLSRTPSYEKGARRSSTCSASSDCSSSMSSPMPSTPQVIAEEDEDDIKIIEPTSFELPESFTFPSSPSPASKKSKIVNPIERFSAPSSDMSPPSRPKLKRRDTPRPKSDVLAMAPLREIPTLSPIDESLPKRRFTSVVDGKSWLVVA